MKKTKMISICIIAIMLLLAICPIISNATESKVITFGDEILAKKVEEILKSNNQGSYREGAKLTVSYQVIDEITSLYINNDIKLEDHIKSLAGLESFKNLKKLVIYNGEFTDLTPILGLTNLEDLQISGATKISGLEQVGKITSLKTLAVSNCNLKTLKGLENLKNLETLYVGNTENVPSSSAKNHIEDFSALEKISLKELNIRNSKYLENLDFIKNVKSLEVIYAENCALKDISALKGLGKLRTFRGDNNHVESVEGIEGLETFWVTGQTIKRFVKLSDYNTETIEVELPQIFTAMVTKGSNINHENSSLTPTNCTITSDNKKISAKKSDIKSQNVEVKVEGDNTGTGTRGCTVTYYEALEIESITREPETSTDGKVKVTIKVNKELDPEKIPAGWTLSNDKKSISKEFNKNGTEDVVLTDKDGSTVTQKVEVANINTEKFAVVDEKQEPAEDGKIKVTITVNRELDPNKLPKGWTLSEDGKSISKVMEKGKTEKVTLNSKDGETIDYSVTANGENFKVVDEEQKEDNGKVKVTIKVNQELDPEKIPAGWTLSEDGKSISKVMNQGEEEKITIYAKDGSKIEYTVKAKTYELKDDGKKDDGKTDQDIPQTGISYIAVPAIALIIIAGTVIFIRQRNMLK